MLEDFQKFLVSEREHKSHIDKINKNFDRIDERLKCLVMSLAKAVQTVARKEGRRDLVVGIHEQTQTNLAQLKKIKSAVNSSLKIVFLNAYLSFCFKL